MRAAANAVRRCSWLCMTLVASTIYVALRWFKRDAQKSPPAWRPASASAASTSSVLSNHR